MIAATFSVLCAFLVAWMVQKSIAGFIEIEAPDVLWDLVDENCILTVSFDRLVCVVRAHVFAPSDLCDAIDHTFCASARAAKNSNSSFSL